MSMTHIQMENGMKIKIGNSEINISDDITAIILMVISITLIILLVK